MHTWNKKNPGAFKIHRDSFLPYILFPNFFCDFFHKCKLCPLLFLCDLVSNLTGCKSTLRTQAQMLQRNILCCFMNSCDHLILIFQFRLLGCDQTKYNFLVRRHLPLQYQRQVTGIFVLQRLRQSHPRYNHRAADYDILLHRTV